MANKFSPSRGGDDHMNMKPKIIRRLIISAAVVGILLFIGWEFKDHMENGELFERHIVSGKPTIDIRIKGLADAGFDAYLVDGWKKKKLFDLLECYTPDFESTTNAKTRNYEGTCITTRGKYSTPMFMVLWSSDTNRVGIAFNGYFVAAFDRTTGQRIQFADYFKDMNVRDRNGGELWHDYKKCDADIERFLHGELNNKP